MRGRATRQESSLSGGRGVTERKWTEEEDEDEEEEEDGVSRASPSASVLLQSCSCCHRLVLSGVSLICR